MQTTAYAAATPRGHHCQGHEACQPCPWMILGRACTGSSQALALQAVVPGTRAPTWCRRGTAKTARAAPAWRGCTSILVSSRLRVRCLQHLREVRLDLGGDVVPLVCNFTCTLLVGRPQRRRASEVTGRAAHRLQQLWMASSSVLRSFVCCLLDWLVVRDRQRDPVVVARARSSHRFRVSQLTR